MRAWTVSLYKSIAGASFSRPHPSLRATFSQREKENRLVPMRYWCRMPSLPSCKPSITAGSLPMTPSRLVPTLLLLACAASAQAADTETEDNVTAKLGGRLHWDIADFDNDTRGTPNADDSDLRALWLDVSGKFYWLN